MIQLTDNLEINKPAPVDDRLGVFESTAEALAYIPLDRRYVGLTVIVDSGSGAEEYWFENGVEDGDLTAKSTGGGGATWGTITGTLSNQTDLNNALDGKVDKVAGKGLSTEDYTSAEKTKLAGIQAGAEVNVNADWNATSGDALILNKPTIPSITNLVPYTGANQDVDLGNNNLNAKSVKINGTAGNGHVGLKHQSVNATAQGSETALFAGSDGELYYKNDGLTLAQIASRAWVNAQGFITNVITALGFTPENVANKQTDLTASATNYPTVNAVNTGLATKVNSNSAITGATKTKITYDSKGLVTAGADLAVADLPSPTPIGYCSPLASIVSGGVITETQITTLTIPAGAFKTGDNILLTLWGTRTTGASSGVNSTVVLRVTNTAGPQILSNITGNRHQNFTITGKVLSDTSIIWWQNSPTTAAATTTVPSLTNSGFVISIGLIRVATTDEFTLYNTIVRKYS